MEVHLGRLCENIFFLWRFAKLKEENQWIGVLYSQYSTHVSNNGYKSAYVTPRMQGRPFIFRATAPPNYFTSSLRLLLVATERMHWSVIIILH